VHHSAPHHTLLQILRKWWRDPHLEGRKVISVNLLREAECDVEDRGIEAEEVLRDRACARVLIAQTRDEDSRVAVIVELEVDTSLGKDCALELGESSVLLDSELILEDKPGLNV